MEHGDMRRHHLSLVLEALLADGASSRAALAQRVGLTKATMSTLVADLLGRGLVTEGSARRDGQVGRPGVIVEPRGTSLGALGLEIRVDEVAACLVDLTGEVRFSSRRRVDNERSRPTTVANRLVAVAEEVLGEAAGADVRCVGGAVAVPGLVDPDTRALVAAPNLSWPEVLLSRVDDRLGLSLAIENEANLAALAELRHGAGTDLRSFVSVTAGGGVGGGVVLERTLVRGHHGFAAEIGHLVVDPGGPACSCGASGCLEAVIGRDGDAPAEVVVDALASALRSIAHVFDPQAVVLGGTLAGLGDGDVADLEAVLVERTLGGRWHPTQVRRSPLGRDAALIGGATLTLDRLITDPTILPPLDSTKEPMS